MTMGYVLIGLLSLVGFATHLAEPQAIKQVPVAPAYTCSGTMNGKTYALSLTVEVFGDGFEFAWLSQKAKLFAGFGIRSENYLAVVSVDSKGNATVIAYQILPGQLVGRWMGQDGTAETELCLVGKPA